MFMMFCEIKKKHGLKKQKTPNPMVRLTHVYTAVTGAVSRHLTVALRQKYQRGADPADCEWV